MLIIQVNIDLSPTTVKIILRIRKPIAHALTQCV